MRVGFGYEIPGMRWRLLQAAVMFAVIGTNIHWKWTDNIYIPSLFGVAAAYLATAGLARLHYWWLCLRYWQATRAALKSEHGAEHGQLWRREPWL